MDLGLMPKINLEVSFMGATESDTEDLDAGSVSLGYYHPVYQVSDKIGVSVGGSYEVVPASDEDVEFGFMALYGALGYSLSDQLSAWTSLGISIPTSEDLIDEDAKNGTHVGLGISYSIDEQFGLSLGYVTNSTTTDIIFDKEKWTFSKLILSLGYKI